VEEDAVEDNAIIQIICTVIAAIVSPVLVLLLEYAFKGRRDKRREAERRAEESRVFDSRMSCLESKVHSMNMLLLKCTITNKELSRQARLDTYDEYKKLGGNSWVDGYVLGCLKISEE
jgi:hypothetical protein